MWTSQRDRIKQALFEAHVYMPIHKRLITIVDSYAALLTKNINNKNFFKTRSFLAYKLLRKDTIECLQEKYIRLYLIPDNIMLLSDAFVQMRELDKLDTFSDNTIQKKQDSKYYRNVFEKCENISEIDSDSDKNEESQLKIRINTKQEAKSMLTSTIQDFK